MTIKTKVVNTEVVKEREQTKVRLYGRDIDGNKDVITVNGFKPYFYAPTTAVKDKEQLLIRNGVVTSIEHDIEKTGLRGENLSRINVTAPWEANGVTNTFEDWDWFESDVWLDNRLRIDLGIYSGVEAPSAQCHYSDLSAVSYEEPQPRIATIDIETDDRGEFVKDGSRPIISIVAHDSQRDETVGFFWTGPDRRVEDCFPDGRPEGVDSLVYTTTETTMLKKFCEYITETDPDILTGWNFTDFDAPYLCRRFEELDGLDPASLSREDYFKDRGYKGVELKGRTLYDLMKAYDNTKQYELDSYKLDDIAKEELGEAKIDHTGMGYYEMWEKDPTKLINYNAQDVILCVKLDEECEVFSFWSALRDELGLDFEDTTENNKFIEMMARRDLHENKIAGPATDYSREESDYDGGYVFDPHVGVEDNVLAIDLASLYPLTMWMSNASPETKVSESEAETLSRAGISICEAPNGAKFRLDKDGVFKRLVDKAISLKSDYKKLRNGATPGTEEHSKYAEKYAVSKTITNSVYGVAGWEKFFLYDEEVAEAITLLGQAVIKKTAKYINEETNGEVIYGDTDSCYISLPDELTIEECVQWGNEQSEILNEIVYPEFAESFGIPAENNRWDIEPEAVVTFFQAGKKKRYASKVYWEDGHTLDEPEYGVKGFECKRSDVAAITKETQKKIFKIILDGGSDGEIMELVSSVADTIASGENLTEIGMPGGIGKELDEYDIEGAHVRGARYMNEISGTNIGEGDKPKRVYLKETVVLGEGEDAESVDVISFEDERNIPDEYRDKLEVDVSKMTEKILVNPMDKILSAVGIDTDAAIRGQTQSGLEAYM